MARFRQILLGMLKWTVILTGALVLLFFVIVGIGFYRRMRAADAAKKDRDLSRQPALIQAVIEQNSEKVVGALSDPAAVNTLSTHGTPPLALAVEKGSTALITEMLRRGANPNAALPNGGWTAVHLAIEKGDMAKAEALIRGGASLEQPNADGETPLILAVSSSNSHVTVPRLIELGAKVNAVDAFGSSALYRAVRKGDVDMVRILLAHGADPNAQSKLPWTPLGLARELAATSVEDAGDATVPERGRIVTKAIEDFLATKQSPP